MKFPFSFDVIYFTEYYNNSSHYRRECGFGIATSFTDAVETIERCYGDDLVAIKHLTLHEESELIYVSPKTMSTYIHNADQNYSYECDALGKMIKKDNANDAK